MKKIFNMPELNVSEFDREDIVTTSARGIVEEQMKTTQAGVKTANVEWNAAGATIGFTF
ncbi:MAG: hypothetical protein PUD92_08610 [Clostridiales bacterium]|nr:hypothetical protein [Clostridiales bacterium]